MEIEKLSEKYIKDVAQIEKACFSKPWDEISIAAELKNEFSEFYIAVENGTAVGFVGLYALTGEADIVRVGVLPQ
uniref:GNAT family N-acetyltransferase n=1 Tax=Eubacterium sp. TaxID=142586 RepID=UPI00402A1387